MPSPWNFSIFSLQRMVESLLAFEAKKEDASAPVRYILKLSISFHQLLIFGYFLFMFFNQLILKITRYKFVAGKLHNEGSTTTSQ